MTLMMSVLPLGLVGGLAYWLWRRYSAGVGGDLLKEAKGGDFLEWTEPLK
jgi:hypothetical protein